MFTPGMGDSYSSPFKSKTHFTVSAIMYIPGYWTDVFLPMIVFVDGHTSPRSFNVCFINFIHNTV